MAHFAKIEDGKVTQVIVIANDVLQEKELDFPETEALGQKYIADVLKLPGDWYQTSYNKKFRYHYAGIGFEFNQNIGEHGAFISPKPFPSWELDENVIWRAPIRYPLDSEEDLTWDEELKNWVPIS